MSTVQHEPLLFKGQRLSRDEFLRRWEGLPNVKYAELIRGVVHMPSPVSLPHGFLNSWIGGWLPPIHGA